MPRIKYLQSFKVVGITPEELTVDTPTGHYIFPNKHHGVEVGDEGMIGKYSFGDNLSVNFLSLEKDIKYCPSCDGVGYHPYKSGNLPCNYCKGQIIVSSDAYYGFYL